MLGLSVIILFNLIYNVNSNLAESSANCSAMVQPILTQLVPQFWCSYFIGNPFHRCKYSAGAEQYNAKVATRLGTIP